MKIRISAPARKDLEAIWRYTDEHWGPRQADRYIDTLLMRLQWLIANPALWRARDDLRADVFAHLEQQHWLYFSATNGELVLLRVLHERMDPARHGI